MEHTRNVLLDVLCSHERLTPFRAPEPLPTLNPRNVVPKNGFPVVKGLTRLLLSILSTGGTFHYRERSGGTS